MKRILITVLSALMLLTTAAYAAPSYTIEKRFPTDEAKWPLRPAAVVINKNFYHEGKKITSAHACWLAGLYKYTVSVADGKLIITARQYARPRTPDRAMLKDSAPLWQPDGSFKPNLLPEGSRPMLKLQLIKPVSYAHYFIGSNGLLYTEGLTYSCNLNFTPSKPIEVVLSTEGRDISSAELFTAELVLSGLSDGVYSIQELVYADTKPAFQEAAFWSEVAVVVHKGVASLQAVESAYGFPRSDLDKYTFPAASYTYGEYYPSEWRGMGWRLKAGHLDLPVGVSGNRLPDK